MDMEEMKYEILMRKGIMGSTMNLPGKGGRKLSVEGYRICQKIFGFN